MAHSRIELQTVLEELCPNVYFQPPTNVQLQYPCIVYKRDYAYTEFAGNNPYIHCKRYQVTVIDKDPDSAIPDALAKLPLTTFNRFFTADMLNHDIYNVYF